MTVLLSDSDVDAFCSDYFPVAFRRFSNGMDRVQKITILLQFAEPERLTQLLQEWQEYNVGARPVNSSLAWKKTSADDPLNCDLIENGTVLQAPSRYRLTQSRCGNHDLYPFMTMRAHA